MSTNNQIVQESGELVSSSGTQYRDVAFTDGAYSPNKPFKGFICAVAGNVNIVGFDGRSCVLPAMAAGVNHPDAGIKILEDLTTATGLVAIF